MEKIIANAINAFFKNMKEIPRMCYIISAIILLVEIFLILFFNYKGDNHFYNFILIFTNIIFTGCLYSFYTIALEVVNSIRNRNKKQIELIKFIKSLSEEEYALMSQFVLGNSTTIYPNLDEIDIIDGINLKSPVIKLTGDYHNYMCAVITEEMLELLKRQLK